MKSLRFNEPLKRAIHWPDKSERAERFTGAASHCVSKRDIVHGRRPPKGIVLDMDSSVSPTRGEQEDSVWNGHYACTCNHPLFVFNQFGDLERAPSGLVKPHRPEPPPCRHDPSHGWIMTQAVGVVHILISSEATKH
jgi:hypothetical protein